MWTCKYCNLPFNFDSRNQKANHSRWCDRNPKSKEFRDQARNLAKKASNAYKEKGVSLETREKLRQQRLGKLSGFSGKKHSAESLEKITTAARNSKHRRLLRSTQEYIKVDGSVVLLDSSWEVALARQLDSLNIKWERPEVPLTWIDRNNRSRNYFPDFYLNDYNIYLDPKNSEALKKQKEKVDWILINRTDVVFLLSLDECKNFNPAVV